ncbi:helix-turn-helix domain-containing protein [Clostridium perfringens]|uniref:helix-turn-helix domain-containing protein n=1 Tax=Clostridium perfringens TaxID=1502 RepID=UPI002330BB9E|nr:helix-turn-helix domain-containing protein [Clostridium perfringens]MDB2046532.1 helix-turn-helix domain-containing protein [Clostridium perfringens]MDB2056539.1 helix-turn-helix domain-containing protein [Clostridium perfringens]
MCKTRHTDDEKRKCVNEYLNGKDKYYLAGKYSISVRTIDRWIAKINTNEIELRKRKRYGCIGLNIQDEILKSLNTNPIIKGFKISQWNEAITIKYIKDKYNININRRMAKNLIEDSKKINDISYEDRVYNEIEEMENLGYNIVLLDYIKIGRIASREIECLELRKYTEEKLDVNLVVIRANNNMYLDIILSEAKVVDKSPRVNIRELSNKFKNNDEYERIVNIRKQQRKDIVNDKYNILDKVFKEERNKKIVFTTKCDKDIKRILGRKNNFKFYIIEDEVYNDLRQNIYEGEYGDNAIYYFYDENNTGRMYRNIREISQVVKGKIERYVLNSTIDNYKLKNGVNYVDENDSNIQKNKDKLRKKIKILKSYFIHNI